MHSPATESHIWIYTWKGKYLNSWEPLLTLCWSHRSRFPWQSAWRETRAPAHPRLSWAGPSILMHHTWEICSQGTAQSWLWTAVSKQMAGLSSIISLITLTLCVIESWRPGQFSLFFCHLPAINMHQSASEKLKAAASLLDIYHALFPANKQIL